MPKKSADYQTLSQELDDVLAQLQAPDVSLDDAVRLYERGLKLIAALEATLVAAETTIAKLKLQAEGGA